ncbi:capsular biosynthesis protein [Vibrio sp. vnigr-6D03]|uniref:glycosyltransferase family 2 protein n=1 Tax=Vibrio sp. vnigr-6D03 TaxID=2058088 RepID=UPI000C32EB7E|nr:glycosyltransferase family 2 protein [Vibrio sp. vnigr-6D03]PKF76401.1 capsular biosynthesis protein [Vibrio sp. vnigr-6D03]
MIIIPMAGMSSRFLNAGYDKPKYMLEARGFTLFEHSISSFKKYFNDERFLFIVKDIAGTKNFVNSKCIELGIRKYDICVLEKNTRGQAETVALGLTYLQRISDLNDESITIFNIDTFRWGFSYPQLSASCDGYLEVFKGQGDNWSFAKPASNYTTEVIETAEKRPISNLCSTGLYFFKTAKLYLDAYEHYQSLSNCKWEKGEIYVAPLYNYLIRNGYKIHYNLIDKDAVIFCGVPDEYIEFKTNL